MVPAAILELLFPSKQHTLSLQYSVTIYTDSRVPRTSCYRTLL